MAVSLSEELAREAGGLEDDVTMLISGASDAPLSVSVAPQFHRTMSKFESVKHEIVKPDNPAIRGMVAKIPHLVEIVEDSSHEAE